MASARHLVACSLLGTTWISQNNMDKSGGRIADICERLSVAFCNTVPLHTAPVKGRKQPSRKEIELTTELGLKKFYEVARAEREQHRLGVIGRARAF